MPASESNNDTDSPSCLNADILFHTAPFLPLRLGAHVSRELRFFRLPETVRQKFTLSTGCIGSLRVRLDLFEINESGNSGSSSTGRRRGGWRLQLLETTTSKDKFKTLVFTAIPSQQSYPSGFENPDFNSLKWYSEKRRRSIREMVPWVTALSAESATEPEFDELEEPATAVNPMVALPGAALANTATPMAVFDGGDADNVIPVLPILDSRNAIWERELRLAISIEEHDGASFINIGGIEIDWNPFKDGCVFEATTREALVSSSPLSPSFIGPPQKLVVGFDESPTRPGQSPGMNATAQESAAYFLTLLSYLDGIKRDGHKLRLRSVGIPESLLLDAIRTGWKLDYAGEPEKMRVVIAGGLGKSELSLSDLPDMVPGLGENAEAELEELQMAGLVI